MNEQEQNLIRELQEDLPIVDRPYHRIAERLNLSEGELLTRVKSMIARGVIRKVGAVLYPRRAGFRANALCVWQVPADELTAVGEMFAALPMITHCYERISLPEWPYNLYTMARFCH